MKKYTLLSLFLATTLFANEDLNKIGNIKVKQVDSISVVYLDDLKKAQIAYENALKKADEKYQSELKKIEIWEQKEVEKTLGKDLKIKK